MNRHCPLALPLFIQAIERLIAGIRLRGRVTDCLDSWWSVVAQPPRGWRRDAAGLAGYLATELRSRFRRKQDAQSRPENAARQESQKEAGAAPSSQPRWTSSRSLVPHRTS